MEIWLTALLSFLGMPACTSWRCGRFLSPLNSHLFHHCHSLLCGSDNGSNYIFVPHHNHSMGGMWYHKAATQPGPQDRICCKACTTKDAQTSGNKMMFVKLVMESFSFLFFFAVVFTPIHSASILPSLNALCSFSGIYWNLVYWHCWDKLPVGEHTAAPLTLQYKNHKTCVAQDCSWYKGIEEETIKTMEEMWELQRNGNLELRISTKPETRQRPCICNNERLECWQKKIHEKFMVRVS